MRKHNEVSAATDRKPTGPVDCPSPGRWVVDHAPEDIADLADVLCEQLLRAAPAQVSAAVDAGGCGRGRQSDECRPAPDGPQRAK